MARSIPVEIGENTFPSKKEALLFYKNILNSYSPGLELNDEDYELVYSLLKIHPKAKQKIGTGILKIRVENDDQNTQCFHVYRQDGTIDNFSYIKCVNGEPNDFTKFSKACRKEIESDLKNIKQNYFNENSTNGKVKCQETKIMIEFNEAHVDHRQPDTFSVIVDRFIELNQINLKLVSYDSFENYGHSLTDKTMASKFREYHNKKAKLRIVQKSKNLGRSYLAKISKQKKDLTIPNT